MSHCECKTTRSASVYTEVVNCRTECRERFQERQLQLSDRFAAIALLTLTPRSKTEIAGVFVVEINLSVVNVMKAKKDSLSAIKGLFCLMKLNLVLI